MALVAGIFIDNNFSIFIAFEERSALIERALRVVVDLNGKWAISLACPRGERWFWGRQNLWPHI